jgi:hypothetical protein
MNAVYTTCATCRRELKMPYIHAISGTTTHPECHPPLPPEADQLFEQFCGIVAKMVAPEYRYSRPDELNLCAIQDRIIALDHAPPRFGDAAAWYAQHYNWPVFPLRPGEKTPATPHGFKDATTDLDRIRRFWDAAPLHNIGVPTGHLFDVIDIDLPHGPKQWGLLRNQPGARDIHGIVRTASGGLHIYIEPTGMGNKAGIRPGIDYRGQGGYVVAPPSWLGPGAGQWKWISKPSPHITGKSAT